MNVFFKLFNYVTTVTKGQECFLGRRLIVNSSISRFHAFIWGSSVHRTAMASKCFKGNVDHYNGITVDSLQESCELDTFLLRLEASIWQWLQEEKRAVWFRIHLPQAEWIPILARRQFKFHHAKEQYVLMYRWLPKEQDSNIPPYAHTNLGVGAFVYNEDTNEILVIKEKHSLNSSMWKLPGGYVEPGENVEAAIIREVSEETGIEALFKCLIAFRHAHNYAFNCSDIYMVAYLSPRTFEIRQCNREIAECKWIKINEYSTDLDVHENNRAIAIKMIEFLQHKMGITANYGVHPITKKPISIYSVTEVDTKRY